MIPGPAALCVHPDTPHTLEAGVAHITDVLAKHFTGHVGPVRFNNGHAETDDPQMVDYFLGDPDRYVVTESGAPDRDDNPDPDDQDDDQQDDDTQE